MKVSPFIFICLLATGLAIGQSSAPENSRGDVFLITIDTLRSDHIHCYGYEQIETPALDQLAKQGIRFKQAFTPSPITNTSHTSILTGLLPSTHGVSDFGVPLKSDYPTLAELQKMHGYRTAAFIGSVILDSKRLAGTDLIDVLVGQAGCGSVKTIPACDIHHLHAYSAL